MDAVASIYNNSELFLKISMVYLPWGDDRDLHLDPARLSAPRAMIPTA